MNNYALEYFFKHHLALCNEMASVSGNAVSETDHRRRFEEQLNDPEQCNDLLKLVEEFYQNHNGNKRRPDDDADYNPKRRL